MKKIISMILAIGFLCLASGLSQVEKPSDLKYPLLKYEPPDPKAFRMQLANGLRGYIQEDHSLPLINISALVNFGDLYVPKDKTGFGSIMSDTLIKGGTKTREGSAIEERIDFLGGSLSFNVSDRISTLSLSVLSKDLDEGLDIFFDVLMNPEFREDALKLSKARLIEQLRQINDQPSGILSREYARLLYGDHPLAWQATRKTYEGIMGADLKAVHSQYFFPKNIILAAAGDFNKNALKNKINKIIAGWKNKSLTIPSLSKQFPKVEPGVYFIQKAINQGYISLGHLGIEDTNPDHFAVQVMNFILGGGSFSSRITMKVRSDEGLSYNQGSRFTYIWGFPGTFSGYVQTKSSTVGYAISLILNEFERIRKEPVSDDEMETAINYYLESFSDNFQSLQATMSNFAILDMTGKPLDYYKTYRDKISAVTKARVQEVARKYIHPDKVAILIVGDWEPCNKGGDKWLGLLEKLGKVHKIALRDPMTGEELK
ncbi:MAG: pitrilysin family protein [Candidatus Aminicenantales bacterium]